MARFSFLASLILVCGPGIALGSNIDSQISHLEALGEAKTKDEQMAILKKFALALGHGADPKKIDLNKPMPLKAQEQGFTGVKVQHKDGETATKDWREEYGKDANFFRTKKSSSIHCTYASAVVLLMSAGIAFGAWHSDAGDLPKAI